MGYWEGARCSKPYSRRCSSSDNNKRTMVDCFFLLVLHQMCTNLTLGKRVTNSRLTQNGQSKSHWILWSTRRETLPDTTHTQTDFFRNTPIMQIIHSAHDRKLISERDALATTVHGFVVMVKGERAQQFAFLHGNCVVQERAICAKSL